MRPDIGPRSDDEAVAGALRSSGIPTHCVCCGLPAYQRICSECMNHVEIDSSDAEAVRQREADHRRRWMKAFALARRHTLQQKDQIAAALQSRDRYRDALYQLWQWHEPKPSASNPRECSCGSRWPCRTAQLIDRLAGEWAAQRDLEEHRKEQHHEQEYQRLTNPAPGDLRPHRPRKR